MPGAHTAFMFLYHHVVNTYAANIFCLCLIHVVQNYLGVLGALKTFYHPSCSLQVPLKCKTLKRNRGWECGLLPGWLCLCIGRCSSSSWFRTNCKLSCFPKTIHLTSFAASSLKQIVFKSLSTTNPRGNLAFNLFLPAPATCCTSGCDLILLEPVSTACRSELCGETAWLV